MLFFHLARPSQGSRVDPKITGTAEAFPDILFAVGIIYEQSFVRITSLKRGMNAGRTARVHDILLSALAFSDSYLGRLQLRIKLREE